MVVTTKLIVHVYVLYLALVLPVDRWMWWICFQLRSIVIIHPLNSMMFHEINFHYLYRSRWGCITFALNYFHFSLYNSCLENREFKWI